MNEGEKKVDLEERNVNSLIVYNIHNWTAPNFRSNVLDIECYVRKMKAAFLCFNEVYDDCSFNDKNKSALAKIAKKGGNYEYYCGKTYLDFGNAILSKTKILNKGKFGVVVEDFEERNIVRAEVEIESRKLQIFCLHLDHRYEKVRLSQLAGFFEKYITKYSDFPHIICGDFNAIVKSDYSDFVFGDIESYRKEKGWEPAYEKVIQYMLRKMKYTDVWRMMNPNVIDNKVVTSRNINTRIDFVFVNDEFLKKFECMKCFVDHAATMSDHFPVVFDFKVK